MLAEKQHCANGRERHADASSQGIDHRQVAVLVGLSEQCEVERVDDRGAQEESPADGRNR